MKSIRLKSRASALTFAIVLLGLVLSPAAGIAETRVRPGFNLFSPSQDIQIGQQSATQIEQQLPMLPPDDAASRYVSALGARLSAYAPGARYPYRFRVA